MNTTTLTTTENQIVRVTLIPQENSELNNDQGLQKITEIEKRIAKKANENMQLALENSLKLGEKIGQKREYQNSLEKETVLLKGRQGEEKVLFKEKMNTIREECANKLVIVKETMQWKIQELKKEKRNLKEEKGACDNPTKTKKLKGRIFELGDLIDHLKSYHVIDKIKIKQPKKIRSKKIKISEKKIKKDKPNEDLWKNSLPLVENFLKKHAKKLSKLEKENSEQEQRVHSLQSSIEKSEKEQEKLALSYKRKVYNRAWKHLNKDIKDLKWFKRDTRDVRKETKGEVASATDPLEKAYAEGEHQQCKEDENTLKSIIENLKIFAREFKSLRKK